MSLSGHRGGIDTGAPKRQSGRHLIGTFLPLPREVPNLGSSKGGSMRLGSNLTQETLDALRAGLAHPYRGFGATRPK
jgi:hypothetical protein